MAVLPLEDQSLDPGQTKYLVTGLAEHLTDQLSRLGGDLHVTPWASSKRLSPDEVSLSEIASMLHVDALVVGRVECSGDRLRGSISVVDPREDRQLMAHEFDSPGTICSPCSETSAWQLPGRYEAA
ncbi:MAG: hypothetical protein R3E12_18495 [Candidatus Eisenbacteria bacterium]